MKIVQFLHDFEPYEWEIGSYVWEFSKNFVSEKYWGVVNVVLYAWKNETRKWYDLDWYRVLFLPTVKIGSRRFLKIWGKEYRSCLDKIKKWNPDTIHTHTRWLLVTLIWLCCSIRWNKKWIYIEHTAWRRSILSWWKSIKRKIYNRTFWKITLIFCNNIVVLTQSSFDYLRKFTSKKINLIYRWVDFPVIKKVERNDYVIRLCFISDIVKDSWIWVLFKAYIDLVKTHPNLMLDIIWDWDEKSDLEKLIVKFWLENWINVLWKKSKEDICNKYLPTYDILVNPFHADEELIPKSILWGLFAKCVVIATDIWAVKEISAFKDLILIPDNDVSALVNAVEVAFTRLDKSGMSYEKVAEQFSWKRNLKQYIDSCYP